MSNPLRILIVEDDPIIAMTIEEGLSANGNIVCSKASSYASAIQLMKKESSDLALVDIRLRDGEPDGIDTALELLRIKQIPIIYLTGNTEDVTYERAKRMTKPVAFLHKPFRVRELSRLIDLALLNHSREEIQQITSASGYLYVPDNYDKIRVQTDQIVYLLADGNYTRFFLTNGEFQRLNPTKVYKHVTIVASLAKVQIHLPNNFYRLSRSLIINLDYLDRIGTNQIILCGHQLDLPEGRRKELMDVLKVVGYPKK